MRSSRSGNEVPNQFEIETPEGRYFQSYDSTIVFIDNEGKIFLDENNWDYSRTTSKYRNDFLRMDTKEIKEWIKNGDIVLTNLN